MTPFEYATGLVSIVIGLAVARVLGGVGVFITARERSGSDWFGASWCIVVLVNLGGWWIAVWNTLQQQVEIEFAILLAVTLATSLLYLASYVLIESRPIDGTRQPRELATPGPAFFYCLGAHFAVVVAMIVPFDLAQEPEDVVETALVAAVAIAGAAAKGTRSRVLHLVIWAGLLFAMLADNTPRIGLSD
jgi:hypothetical protein